MAIVTDTESSYLRHHFWFQGIFFIFLGALAVLFPFLFSVGFTAALGILLLIGGFSQLIHAFQVRKVSSFILSLLIAVLFAFVGVALLSSPLQGLAALTIILAILFIVQGIITFFFAIIKRPPSWGWLMLSGVVSFLLGVIVWSRWPVSALWFIGILIGINLVFYGISQMTVAASLEE